MMAATSTKKPSVDPTDAATIVAVGTGGVVLSDGGAKPASIAADSAMRSYKHIGSAGEVFDITQRTSGLLVSQLKTF